MFNVAYFEYAGKLSTDCYFRPTLQFSFANLFYGTNGTKVQLHCDCIQSHSGFNYGLMPKASAITSTIPTRFTIPETLRLFLEYVKFDLS